MVHAELNAILNSGGRVLKGAKLYVALFPCNECAKAIIQSGIREVIYLSDKYADTDNVRASKRMLHSCRCDPIGSWITQLEEISLFVFRMTRVNRAVCGYPKGRCCRLVAMAGFLRKKVFLLLYFFPGACYYKRTVVSADPNSQFQETPPVGGLRQPGT